MSFASFNSMPSAWRQRPFRILALIACQVGPAIAGRAVRQGLYELSLARTMGYVRLVTVCFEEALQMRMLAFGGKKSRVTQESQRVAAARTAMSEGIFWGPQEWALHYSVAFLPTLGHVIPE